MSRETQGFARKPSLVLCGLSVVAVVSSWILFVGGTRRNEMLVGAGVLFLTAAFAYQVWRIETLQLQFRAMDIIQAWRIPWYIISGVHEIVAILIKDLLGIKPAHSFYRVSGFKTSKSNPRQIARRVLATFYTTMAPNFIVIGIDTHQSRMLFHQLERRWSGFRALSGEASMRVLQMVLLGGVVILCWLGVVGMWRMKEPMQALHYLSLPATAGAILLTIAVLISQGLGQAFWKVLLITGVLFATNSVVTHATARAFRARELGHWEPTDGDPMEMVHEEKKA